MVYIPEEQKSLLKCYKHSRTTIKEVRKDFISNFSSDEDFSIITTGSYARSEASEESDIDWFIVYKDNINPSIKSKVESLLSRYVKKDVGSSGTFGASIEINDLLTNFGGENDSNHSFTRRMLLLLESKCLYNDDFFNKIKRELLEIYIKESISDHQINKFFLNDIIRYYRTMCTDFEYKVSEKGKSWGVRNIKLRFSRKLLYFSGVLVVAETCYHRRDDKVDTSLKLLNLSPIERIIEIMGNSDDCFLEHYNEFLKAISDKYIRKELDDVDKEKRNENETYSRLKNRSQHFSWELSRLLRAKYDMSHPIHHSLIL